MAFGGTGATRPRTRGGATTDPATLSDRERRQALHALLALTFLSWGGFYLVVPLISVHYVEQLGWAAGAVGVVLAARQFAQQGTTLFSGIVADRVGAKRLIAGGMLVRSAGFAMMAFAGTYPLLLGSAMLAALGGGLFDSPKSAAIAALARPEERPRFYAQAGVAAGLGMTVGTQLGALLLRADFAAVSLAGAAVYVGMFLLVLRFVPAVRVADERADPLAGIRGALRDRPFTTYVGLDSGLWFMNTQFFITLPLAATAIAGTPEAVAWVFAVNSLVTVLLAYPVPRAVGRHLPPIEALVLGFALTALGLLGIGLSTGTPMLLAMTFLFSLGTVLARPNEQTVTAGLANPAALGSYFGVAALSVAFGGGLGSIAGGTLYDVGTRLGHPVLPWAVCAAVGLLAAAGLLVTTVPHLTGRRVPRWTSREVEEKGV